MKVNARRPRSKYNAKPTEWNGHRYDSKAEATYAQQLDSRLKAGEILFWLRQVPVDLTEHDRYRLDFLVVESDGTLYGVEIKGFETQGWKRIKKIWKSCGPFPLRVRYADREEEI